MLFKKSKKVKKEKEQKDNNSHNPAIFAHIDIWAIDKCVKGREPWEDVCLKCGECGRFSE